MKIAVTVSGTHSHTLRTVLCNANTFRVPLPAHPILDLFSKAQVDPQFERCLAIISKTQKEVESVEEFYSVQAQAKKYFSVDLSINYLQLSLALLSQSEINSKELDKLALTDMLGALKCSHDSLAKKVQGKFNRRIRKYLAQSKRPQEEKEQIQTLIHIMKAETTEQEDSNQLIQKKKNKKTEPEKQQARKDSRQLEQHQFLSEQNSEFQLEKGQKQKNRKQPRKNEKLKDVQDDQNQWEDVTEQKTTKRKEKHYHKKKQMSEELVGIEGDSDEEGTAAAVEKPNKRRKFKQKSDQGLFSQFKEKTDKDIRVQLGITGDTEQGWRQRYRIKRAPNDNIVSKGPEGSRQNPIMIT